MGFIRIKHGTVEQINVLKFYIKEKSQFVIRSNVGTIKGEGSGGLRLST